MPKAESDIKLDDPIQNMLRVAKVKDEKDFQGRNKVVAAESSRVERTPIHWIPQVEVYLRQPVAFSTTQIKRGPCKGNK